MSGADAMAVKVQTGDRKDYRHYLDIQMGLVDFKGIDYATKEEVNCGNIGDWGDDTILCIDGLTPISDALWAETKGARIDPIQSDYGAIQNKLNTLISNITQNTDCSILLLGHAKLATDEVTGLEKVSVNIPGNALAGTFPGYFDNVIYAKRTNKGEFVWTGKQIGVSIVARDIPELDGLIPDFSLKDYNFFGDMI